jgi:hypothetical protein
MTYILLRVKLKATAPVVAVLLLSAASTLLAAPPFDICRSTEPSQVGLAVPLAVVTTGPYDDSLDLLDDGATYFYLVRDDAGQVLDISVNKNDSLNTVRIGFDDENELSGPLDPSNSSVVASPDTVPADGVTTAIVIVTPRDTDGVPLGAGLDVTVDGIGLWPGTVQGPVTDRGDGSYEIRIVSTTPGTGEVWVSAEGIPLSDEPTITFEDFGPPMGLRDLGRQLLDDMTKEGGLFEEILEGLDPNTDPGADKVAQAWDEAVKALANLPEGDFEDDADAIGNDLKSALGQLVAALDNPGGVDPASIQGLIDYLLDAARLVALEHLTMAEESCGPCVHPSDEACQAQRAFDQAEEERVAQDPKYVEIAHWYSKTIDKAQSAVDDCS